MKLTVNVSGDDVTIDVKAYDFLDEIRARALLAYGYDKRHPMSAWEIRDERGVLLEPLTLLRDHQQPDGSLSVRIFLSLAVGVGA